VLKETIAGLQRNLVGLGASELEGESAKFENDRDALNIGQQNDVNGMDRAMLEVGALAAVQNVVRGMRDLPGRKSVVFVGDGFSMLQQVDLGPNVARPDFFLPRPAILEAFRLLVDEANRSFVIIHTINTMGVFSPVTSGAKTGFSAEHHGRGLTGSETTAAITELHHQQQGPLELAHEAGGLTFSGNDYSIGLGQALADSEGYYVLGYQPDASTFQHADGKRADFHQIKVKVKKSGLQVRTRSGFFGIPDAETRLEPRTPEEHLWRIAASPFVATDLGIHVAPIFAHLKSGDLFRVFLHFDGNALTFSKGDDGQYRAPIEVLAALVDARGAAIEAKVFKLALRTDAQPDEALLAAGFNGTIDIPAARPGAYQLRVAARDVTSNRAGTGYQFVRVPNVGTTRLALSGVALQGDAASASPSLRRFTAASTVHYAFAAYNTRVDPKAHRPALTLRLRLFHNGTLLVDGPPVPIDTSSDSGDPDGTAEVAGELQLSPAIKPGNYQLQIEVKDTLAPAKTSIARQWVDFTVASAP